MKGERLHDMVRDQIGAQLAVVGAHQMISGRGADVAAAIMTRVKQEPGAAHDADVPDPEEQRARRLAVPLDAKLHLVIGLDRHMDFMWPFRSWIGIAMRLDHVARASRIDHSSLRLPRPRWELPLCGR